MPGLTGNVFITGAGTLTRAILRRARVERWAARFTIYSRSEYRQAMLRLEHPECRYIIGDIRDYDRLEPAMAAHDLVVHGAAQKRLPECETHVQECADTNIFGSINVYRAAINNGVRQCIGISTDKVCKGITSYGASKLIMEKLFMSAPLEPCVFSIVRYGNVVASNGSVIPLWRRQAAEGKPLTITNRSCTRFWMAPSDAVRLIVEAFERKSQTILVPRMGSLSIEDMARIIAPGSEMVDIGFRSMEKVHEDLVHADEPARIEGDRFVIGEEGAFGHIYTSEIAPRLSESEFLQMLEEAESFE